MRLLRAAALLIFAVFLGYPLAKVGLRSGSPIAPEFLSVVKAAGWQAVLSTLATLVVGLPLGILFAKYWSRWSAAFAAVTFSLPSIFIVAFIQGVLSGSEFRVGLPAVIAAHVFLNAPWIALAVGEGIRSVPKEWIHAARTLGATPRRTFRALVLPTAARRMGIAAAQVFSLCLGSFAIVLILGGGPPVTSLETEIYASVRGGSLALGSAAHYAMAQLVLGALPIWWILARRGGEAYRDSLSLRSAAEPTASFAARALALGMGIWVVLPAIYFARSLDFGSMALPGTAELAPAAAVSLRIAGWAVLFVLAFGALVAWTARTSVAVRFLAAIPLGLSPLVLSLGFFLAYSEWVDPFEGSELAMVIVQGLLFLPFSLRIFLPLVDGARSGARRDLQRVARSLGATRSQAWKMLEWPRWRTASARVGGLVFVWSLSEVAAASFFGSERLVTLGRLLMIWYGQYRFAEAGIVLLGMYLASIAVLFWAERPRGERVDG